MCVNFDCNLTRDIHSLFTALSIPEKERKILMSLSTVKTYAGKNELKELLLYLINKKNSKWKSIKKHIGLFRLHWSYLL
jgi:hypothetical protein